MVNEKEEFIDLIKSTNKVGTKQLLDYLETSGFFESPASTRFHGNYPRGLLKHSLNVYKTFKALNENLKLGLEENSIIICALLHDVCKAGAYIKRDTGYLWNNAHPKGHGTLSVQIISQFIKLTERETKIIALHMNLYQTREFSGRGEYSLRDLTMHSGVDFAIKLFYFSDEIATFLENENKN